MNRRRENATLGGGFLFDYPTTKFSNRFGTYTTFLTSFPSVNLLEEMGGVRGVLHYMQRSALQGTPATLTAVGRQWVMGGPLEPR